jgi:RND family efflux transporter MFP subunit
MRRSYLLLIAVSVASLALAGCGRSAAQSQAAAPPPQVNVAQVIARQVTESDEFTGRFEAVERVEVRPRVSGYISSVNFTDGADVSKGDVLFVIDPRPYEAERNRARAQLAQARSQLELAKSQRDRATALLAKHAISQEEFDTRTAGNEQAEANVAAAQAALDSAALNLGFTRVLAPISGRISRALVTGGNLVGAGQTLLTTVVSLDPIYVSFDGDEQVYLKYLKAAHAAATRDAQDVRNPVHVGLADESGYPHEGVLVFMDNALDPATGTIRSRARLENHDRLFTPGLFARIKLLGSAQHAAILVQDSAVGTDQTERFVLVVGNGDKVSIRPVKLGPIVDGLRVVAEGLTPGETIVVNGLQRVRPGAQVSPQRVAMQERGDAHSLVAQSGPGASR